MPVITQSDGKGGLKAADGKQDQDKSQSTSATAHAAAHKANLGPVIPDKEKLPEKASREELDKRMEELNK